MRWLCVCGALALISSAYAQITDEEEAILFLEELNGRFMDEREMLVTADWAYYTNLTDHNAQEALAAAARFGEFQKQAYVEASEFAWQDFSEPVRRQFLKVTDIGNAVLPDGDLDRVNELRSIMTRMYSTAEVCDRPGDDTGACYPLEPDLEAIIASSRDWEELTWAWEGWRTVASRQMRPLYAEFADLLNQGAVLNGYDDNGDYWRSWYDVPTFEEDMAMLWEQVKPLYVQLHAFVRRKLQETYPENEFPASGHIPAHLLGNMWAQSWNFISDVALPFPDKPDIDVTDEMIAQGYDALRMFQVSEEFFTSLGLLEMPPPFWEHSMIEKPEDRDVVCHASAWDFYNQVDFRIKQCTEVNQRWLGTTHHEMGHVEYFLQYQNQPVWYRTGANPVRSRASGYSLIMRSLYLIKQCTEVNQRWLGTTHHEMGHVQYYLQYQNLPTWYRRGANPGFHEAIGDVMDLSVVTPEHLQEIGLLPDFVDDPEVDLNFLMQQALSKIAFLPFGYLIDQWRWKVFDGTVTPDNYNTAWWDNRCLHQGISAPVPRSEEDFDPGAKYHIPGNTPYIRYFVSYIIQFQFHEALCAAAGYEGPLHRCDIYRSQEAGQLIGNMMELGASLPWPDAMEAITGSREKDAGPLIEYFRPLLEWLEEQNEGFPVGWDDECPN